MMSLWLFLEFISMFIIWLLLELNLLGFAILTYLKKEDWKIREKRQQCLFYFIIQSFARIILITSICWSSGTWNRFSSFFLILSLAIKIGLWPLQFWVFKITVIMRRVIITILLTLQKLPLIALILYSREIERITLLIIVTSVLGVTIIYKRKTIKELIVASSLYSSLWLIVLIKTDNKIFLVYIIFYAFSNLILLEKEKINEIIIRIKIRGFVTIFSAMYLIGLPPLISFFFKIYSVGQVYEISGIINILVLWIITIIATIGYFKFLYNKFHQLEKYYVKISLIKMIEKRIFAGTIATLIIL